MTTGDLAARERKIVRALLVPQSEIDAGAAPFLPMRRDPAASGALMREQVREFVAQRAIDLIVTEFAQARV